MPEAFKNFVQESFLDGTFNCTDEVLFLNAHLNVICHLINCYLFLNVKNPAG